MYFCQAEGQSGMERGSNGGDAESDVRRVSAEVETMTTADVSEWENVRIKVAKNFCVLRIATDITQISVQCEQFWQWICFFCLF